MAWLAGFFGVIAAILGGYRTVWTDLLHRTASHSRNRNPRGARRHAVVGDGAGAAGDGTSGRCRPGDWSARVPDHGPLHCAVQIRDPELTQVPRFVLHSCLEN